MKEEWKFLSLKKEFAVSNYGRMKSYKKHASGRIVRGGVSGKYLRIQISEDFFSTVHSLVALHFIGPRRKGLVIDHIDSDKLNNVVTNLQYITQKANLYKSERMVKVREKKSRPVCFSFMNIVDEFIFKVYWHDGKEREYNINVNFHDHHRTYHKHSREGLKEIRERIILNKLIMSDQIIEKHNFDQDLKSAFIQNYLSYGEII